MNKPVNLYEPIVCSNVGAPPLVLNVVTNPAKEYSVGGVQKNSTKKVEQYVLYSILPEELKHQVRTCVQVNSRAM